VSIVIVALNEAGRLARTLQAIERMPCPREDYEVIVVDGGSTDSTAQVAQQAGARLIAAQGRNIPASRNIGVANAKAPVIAFLDADCAAHPEWLRRGLRHFEGGQDLLVGSPAGLPENPSWVQRLWADHWRLKAAAARGAPYRLLTTRNLFATRSLVEAVGGFDEELNTGEDYYFCYKAHAQGFPLRCDNDVSVAHMGEPATLRDFFQEQVWHASNGVSARLLKKGVWTGLNALLFGVYMAVGLLALLVGGIVGCAGGGWTPALIGLVLTLGGPLGLALRAAAKTGHWGRVPGYAVLYLAYGLARAAALWPGLWITRKRAKSF
jgi:glycosyltransferase involved in cell wall biosynthesis